MVLKRFRTSTAYFANCLPTKNSFHAPFQKWYPGKPFPHPRTFHLHHRWKDEWKLQYFRVVCKAEQIYWWIDHFDLNIHQNSTPPHPTNSTNWTSGLETTDGAVRLSGSSKAESALFGRADGLIFRDSRVVKARILAINEIPTANSKVDRALNLEWNCRAREEDEGGTDAHKGKEQDCSWLHDHGLENEEQLADTSYIRVPVKNCCDPLSSPFRLIISTKPIPCLARIKLPGLVNQRSQQVADQSVFSLKVEVLRYEPFYVDKICW